MSISDRFGTCNFNEIIHREGTGSAKWDGMGDRFGNVPADALPMWVADMDFRPPPSVQQTMEQIVSHGLYGYPYDPNGFESAALDWMRRRHGWAPDVSSMVYTHGVLSALSIALQAYSDVGDRVIAFTPVYHVYATLVRDNQRELLSSPLVLDRGRYHMDLATLERQLTGRERVVLLCSPHNPGGTVWTRQELQELAAFCQKHGLIIICDEVHHDLVYSGNIHWIINRATPKHTDRLVTLVSPTKTFNIAGAMAALAIIENDDLRAKFEAVNRWVTISDNGIGRAMARAAYESGADWLDDLVGYVECNRDVFEQGARTIPGVRVMKLQATYLAWVNFSATGLSADGIRDRCYRTAGVIANAGPSFGPGGNGWMRFNLAAPTVKIVEAVTRLQRAFALNVLN